MVTLFALLLTLLAIAVGALATYLVNERLTLTLRLCGGTVFGLALLAWLGLLSALVLGLNATSIALTTIVLLAALTALWRATAAQRKWTSGAGFKAKRWEFIYYCVWGALLIQLFSRVVMFYPDGLHSAPANNYGDLPFHFSAITSFAYGENLPPENPIFAGLPFTYPFLIDFLTAFYIRVGADWRAAFFLENIALALALVGLLNFLTYRLTGNRLAARLAPVIFLFNGGLGFLNFFRDLSKAPHGLFNFLAALPSTYTMNAELALPSGTFPLRWGNVFTTLLIPQRSMLFGLPFVALIITLWWMAWGEGAMGAERRRYLLAAGVLAGLLPLLHAHGFFAVMIVSVLLALLFFSLEWAAFFIPAALLAAPQALYLSGTQVKNALFKWQPRWEAGDAQWLLFWLVNAGVFLVLLLVALSSKHFSSTRLRLFYLPFALWFILPNLVLLAPWPWDNIKILVYWALASAPLVAFVVAYLWSRGVAARMLSFALLALLTLSGALDVLRALSPIENLQLFGAPELEVAARLRELTPPRARILHAPIHNSVIALTGRQSLLGYPGHLWTHGIDYGARETEVQTIYRGGPTALQLLAKNKIDYVLIGPVERQQLRPDESFFAAEYPTVLEQSGYRVFQIKRSESGSKN